MSIPRFIKRSKNSPGCLASSGTLGRGVASETGNDTVASANVAAGCPGVDALPEFYRTPASNGLDMQTLLPGSGSAFTMDMRLP